jgi:hypothetical protein
MCTPGQPVGVLSVRKWRSSALSGGSCRKRRRPVPCLDPSNKRCYGRELWCLGSAGRLGTSEAFVRLRVEREMVR